MNKIIIKGIILLLVIILLVLVGQVINEGLTKKKIIGQKRSENIIEKNEEFLNEISEMTYVGWRFFIYDKKGEFVWNPPFKKMLQLELNFTSKQLEEIEKFLKVVEEWKILEQSMKHEEYFLKYSELDEKKENR